VATPSPRKHREDIDKWRQRLCDALRLSNVVLFGQDEELRYVWIENPPNGLDSGDIIGKRDEDFLAPKTAEQTTSAKLSVLRTGEPKTIEFSWESEETPRWYELRIEALHGADRRVTGVNCAAIDVSDRKLTESHLRVLLLELAHRSKNLLAVIQGISNQTAQGSASVDEFVRRFSGRLMSLARAHDILSDQNWRGAGMHELIRTQVLLFAGERQTRIAYEGDALYLRPTAAQHVGLALYELTANALRRQGRGAAIYLVVGGEQGAAGANAEQTSLRAHSSRTGGANRSARKCRAQLRGKRDSVHPHDAGERTPHLTAEPRPRLNVNKELGNRPEIAFSQNGGFQ
jgi:two-component sensor histidine kinase